MVTCAAGTLASGGSASFAVNVIAGSAGSSIVNTGTVVGDQYDPVPANNTSTATTTLNHNPVCTAVTAGPALWPPNHKLVAITLTGATDPDGDPLTWTITGVTQDEPTNVSVTVTLRSTPSWNRTNLSCAPSEWSRRRPGLPDRLHRHRRSRRLVHQRRHGRRAA